MPPKRKLTDASNAKIDSYFKPATSVKRKLDPFITALTSAAADTSKGTPIHLLHDENRTPSPSPPNSQQSITDSNLQTIKRIFGESKMNKNNNNNNDKQKQRQLLGVPPHKAQFNVAARIPLMDKNPRIKLNLVPKSNTTTPTGSNCTTPRTPTFQVLCDEEIKKGIEKAPDPEPEPEETHQQQQDLNTQFILERDDNETQLTSVTVSSPISLYNDDDSTQHEEDGQDDKKGKKILLFDDEQDNTQNFFDDDDEEGVDVGFLLPLDGDNDDDDFGFSVATDNEEDDNDSQQVKKKVFSIFDEEEERFSVHNDEEEGDFSVHNEEEEFSVYKEQQQEEEQSQSNTVSSLKEHNDEEEDDEEEDDSDLFPKIVHAEIKLKPVIIDKSEFTENEPSTLCFDKDESGSTVDTQQLQEDDYVDPALEFSVSDICTIQPQHHVNNNALQCESLTLSPDTLDTVKRVHIPYPNPRGKTILEKLHHQK